MQILGAPQLKVLRSVEKEAVKAKRTLSKFLENDALMAVVDADRKAILNTLHSALKKL